MTTTSGIVDGSSVKMEPKRICWETPVVALLVVSRYRNNADESGREAEHDAGRHVAPAKALDTREIHGARTEHPRAEEADQRTDVEEERSRSTGRRDVGERVARKGLAAHDGEDADDGRHDRRHAANDEARCAPARSKRTRVRR